MVLTTTSITAVSVSTRSDQATCRSPECDPGKQRDPRVVMHEADIDQRDPGQAGRNQQQPGRDQFGRARARRRRLDGVIVVAVIVGVIVVGIRRMGIGAMRVVMMLDRIAARIARMRAEYRRSAPREWRRSAAERRLPGSSLG